MTQYLQTAKNIHTWLENLQIKQHKIAADISDGQFHFTLRHPVDGDLTVRQPVENELFTAHGIVLRPIERSDQRATLEVYDHGGIYDPIDGRVPGEHYSASHFALLSAILFSETGEPHYLEAAKLAIGFHLRTSPTEYQPMSEWMYHWDFQNYAFVLTYRLLEEHLSDNARKAWRKGLKSWRTNHRNKLTNWAAMRAWAFAERHKALGNRLDEFRVDWNLRYVERARSSDGCFDDNHNLSRPIQYHIFTVAILHRLLMHRPAPKIRRWFEDGINYFLPFIDPDGDFNYLGRGHEQIFGYGAAIYALEAGYKEGLGDNLPGSAGKLFDYLLNFQRGDHFPLVLNNQPDEDKPGWYDYHHLTVYNAFLGAWLALAHTLKNPPSTLRAEKREPATWISKPTGTAIYARPSYFAAFYSGLPEYLSEGTITPHHLWWKDVGFVFSCPGGPTPDRFGKHAKDNEKNYLAPIARNGAGWIVPSGKSAKTFEAQENRLLMDFDFDTHTITRTVTFEDNSILVEDEIVFLQNVEFDEFRFFNLPLAMRQLDIESIEATRITLARNGKRLIFDFGEDYLPVQQLDVVMSAKGPVQTLAKRAVNFRAYQNDKRRIRFRIGAIDPSDGLEPSNG